MEPSGKIFSQDFSVSPGKNGSFVIEAGGRYGQVGEMYAFSNVADMLKFFASEATGFDPENIYGVLLTSKKDPNMPQASASELRLGVPAQPKFYDPRAAAVSDFYAQRNPTTCAATVEGDVMTVEVK